MDAAHASATDHMDRIYRYQRFIYDFTRKPYLLGRDRLLGELEPGEDGSVLEVGCGTGRNLVQAAKRYPKAQFFGFDVSSSMLKTARRSVARSGLLGLSDRITLAEGDATNFDAQATFGQTSFDRVYVSYALSMIPPWREALGTAYSCVAPGGSLHIVDFGQQESLPGWFKTLLFAWLRQFDVNPIASLRSELKQLAKEQQAELRFSGLYRGYAYIATLHRPL